LKSKKEGPNKPKCRILHRFNWTF